MPQHPSPSLCPVPGDWNGGVKWIALAFILSALVLASVARPSGDTRGVTPFWAAVAQCETGSTWNWGAPGAKNAGGSYQGGVGFYASTWTAWATELRLVKRWPHAYMAPPAVQVRVASYGLRVHRGSWGCLHAHPEIYRLPGR